MYGIGCGSSSSNILESNETSSCSCCESYSKDMFAGCGGFIGFDVDGIGAGITLLFRALKCNNCKNCIDVMI